MFRTESYNKELAGFQQAQIITKKYAQTYYIASWFLCREKKYAAYSLYAICRITDETVDGNQLISPAGSLNQLKKSIDLAYSSIELQDNLLIAFRSTVNKYNVPRKYFDELIEGMYMDLNKNRYANFDELYGYCYKVAGVTGLMMLKIFGQCDNSAEPFAVNLGIAMQLTNILRDIKEDYLRGRIYLPQDQMRRLEISENQLAEGKIDESFKQLLRDYIRVARQHYAQVRIGIKLLPDLRSRLVACAMKDIYGGILGVIEKNNYDVFSQRCRLTTAAKIGLLLKILFKGEYL